MNTFEKELGTRMCFYRYYAMLLVSKELARSMLSRVAVLSGRTFFSRVVMDAQHAGEACVVPMACLICAGHVL